MHVCDSRRGELCRIDTIVGSRFFLWSFASRRTRRAIQSARKRTFSTPSTRSRRALDLRRASLFIGKQHVGSPTSRVYSVGREGFALVGSNETIVPPWQTPAKS